MRHLGSRILLALIGVVLLATAPGSAHAALTFESTRIELTSALAGGHPDGTVTLNLAREHGFGVEGVTLEAEGVWPHQQSPGKGGLSAGGDLREVVVKLPPGTLADVNNIPKCPSSLFSEEPSVLAKGGCPSDTQVGEAIITFSYVTGARTTVIAPPVGVYNLQPPPGEPALLGIQGMLVGEPVTVPIRVSVSAADNYAVTTRIQDTAREPVDARALGATVTLWGVPAAPHKRRCEEAGSAEEGFSECRAEEVLGGANLLNGGRFDGASGIPPIELVGGGNGAFQPKYEGVLAPSPPSDWKPFLELPTSCSQSGESVVRADTYQEPEVFTEASGLLPLVEGLPAAYLAGCGSVPFAPGIDVSPDTAQTGAPTGVSVNLKVPQNNDPIGQRASEVQKVSVTLPPGLTISPSAASNGLKACTDAQFNRQSNSAARCPAASQVGTAEVDSPSALSAPITGGVYLAQPLSNDPTSGKMFRVFVELKGFGLDVKLAGSVIPDLQTGQITGTFENLPELPFSEARLHFNGGPNAVLVNPSTCGPHTATGQLTPYSNPEIPANVSSSFETSYDGRGVACPEVLPFNPTATISSANPQAGASAPFTVSFVRPDGSQAVSQITATLPLGLLGYISKIQLCDPADAAAGTCPPQSRIGTVSGTGGPGPDPVTIPGNVYLAEGSNGYPFELSVVVPAVAGPFDIGNVVVIAYIKVNSDGSITATSGPVPSILDGVPVDIRSATLTIDRPGFAVNPTNCGPLMATGSLTSLAGTTADVSAPFQVSGCGSLPFKPSFTVATRGSTSRVNGESLTVRVSQKPGEANLQKVKVELPKALPSRLTTLQKACPEGVFYANPAACDRASLVGTIVAYTPLLSKPLVGPAYFVSHGGAKFPELIIVLQGDGVTVEVAGETFISKAGVTSSTFPAIPDVPVSGFELTLPEGRYSAIAANGTPCKEDLIMPTTLVGQNGVVVKQKTRIAVTGCPKTRNAKAARRKAKHTRGRSTRR
jgi:hypothetical protein